MSGRCLACDLACALHGLTPAQRRPFSYHSFIRIVAYALQDNLVFAHTVWFLFYPAVTRLQTTVWCTSSVLALIQYKLLRKIV